MRKRCEQLTVLKRIPVCKPFISRSNGLACRSNALSYPFHKNSSSVQTAQAICSRKLISRSNSSSYPFAKNHQSFEWLELSVQENSFLTSRLGGSSVSALLILKKWSLICSEIQQNFHLIHFLLSLIQQAWI